MTRTSLNTINKNQMEEYLDKVIEQAQDDDSNRAEATKIEGCRTY
jgi:hypothetical protein